MSRLLALSCNNSIGNTSTVCAIQLVVDCLRLLMGKLRAEDCEDREDRRPDTGLGSGISYPMFAGEVLRPLRFLQPLPRLGLSNPIRWDRLIEHQDVFPLCARVCITPTNHNFGHQQAC